MERDGSRTEGKLAGRAGRSQNQGQNQGQTKYGWAQVVCTAGLLDLRAVYANTGAKE